MLLLFRLFPLFGPSFNIVSPGCSKVEMKSLQGVPVLTDTDRRANYPNRHREHWLEDVHHLCHPERDMGSDNLLLLP